MSIIIDLVVCVAVIEMFLELYVTEAIKLEVNME